MVGYWSSAHLLAAGVTGNNSLPMIGTPVAGDDFAAKASPLRQPSLAIHCVAIS